MTVEDIDLFELKRGVRLGRAALHAGAEHSARQDQRRGRRDRDGPSARRDRREIFGTVLDELERRNLSTALVTLCIGAGMGTATIIERV